MKFNKDIAIGHLASAATYAIFGINIIACRDIAIDGGLAPIVLFVIRALVAGVLFWIVSLIGPREKVPPRDLLKVAGAGIIGIFLPQLTFLHAIARTAPVDLSIITTITPILTMLFAAFFLKEPITWKKVLGVFVSFGGIVWLILQSVAVGGGAESTDVDEVDVFGVVYSLAAVCIASDCCDGFCCSAVARLVGGGVSGILRHVYSLFPYTYWTAAYTPYAGQYVWLFAADYCHWGGYCYGYGQLDGY